MKSLPEIQSAISRLSPDEMRQLLDWMDHQLEDRLELTDELKHRIASSESDLAAGKRSRIR